MLPAERTLHKTCIRGRFTPPKPGNCTYDPVTYAEKLLLWGVTHPEPGKYMYDPVTYAETLLIWALERANRRKASTVSAETSPGQAGGEGPRLAAFSARAGSAAFGW